MSNLANTDDLAIGTGTPLTCLLVYWLEVRNPHSKAPALTTLQRFLLECRGRASHSSLMMDRASLPSKYIVSALDDEDDDDDDGDHDDPDIPEIHTVPPVETRHYHSEQQDLQIQL